MRNRVTLVLAGSLGAVGPAHLPTYLSDADRTRIGDPTQDPELQQHLTKARDLWPAKLNGSFTHREHQVVFKDAQVDSPKQNERKMAQLTIPAHGELGAVT